MMAALCPSPLSCGVRAEVFTVACVVLSALGHALMSGQAVPWWSLVVAAGGIGPVAWLAAARERSLPAIAVAVLVTEGVLHLLFCWAQDTAGGDMADLSSQAALASVWANVW